MGFSVCGLPAALEDKKVPKEKRNRLLYIKKLVELREETIKSTLDSIDVLFWLFIDEQAVRLLFQYFGL